MAARLEHANMIVRDMDRTVRFLQTAFPEYRNRRRVYFYDPDGNDWEFAQYVSGDPALCNDYTLPDR